MLPPTVVSHFPFRVNDWAFTDFDDAITGLKPHNLRRLDKFHMSPLIAMMVDVISDLR